MNKEEANKEKPVKNKTIAVVQLTRTGDIVQTLTVFREMKALHPEINLILIARKRFSKPLEFLLNDVFSTIYHLTPLSFSQNQESLDGCIEQLDKTFKDLDAEDIDVLINLSFCKTSSLITRLTKTRHRLGFCADNKGREIAFDSWSQYVASSVMRGSQNGFSLVDIYKMIVGIKERTDIKARPAHKSSSRQIILHPFASHSKKHWKPNKWVEILYKILKDHQDLKVHIVGSESEALQADQICEAPILKNFSDRIFSHAGKTNIKQTWELINHCSLFIGHDSMVSHLAALAKIQCLTISLGTVRPEETSPYGENHYVLSPRTKCFPCFPTDKCELYQCHSDISYHAVSASASLLITKGEILSNDLDKNIPSFHLSSFNFYRTSIDESGLFLLDTLNKYSTPNINQIFRKISRMAWLYLFEQKEETASFFELNSKTYQELEHIQSGLSHLFDLCEFGKKYSRLILEEIAASTVDIAKLKEHSKKLDEIDSLTSSLRHAHPILESPINFLELQKSTLGGDNLVKISESAYLTYDKGSLFTKIIYDLVEANMISFQKTRQEKNPQI